MPFPRPVILALVAFAVLVCVWLAVITRYAYVVSSAGEVRRVVVIRVDRWTGLVQHCFPMSYDGSCSWEPGSK
jgi:hypothetical protein